MESIKKSGKKAAILTIVSYNLGNRLQNYALQKVLNNLDIEAVTLRRKADDVKFKTKVKKKIHSFRNKTMFDRYCKFNDLIKWSNGYIDTKEPVGIRITDYDKFIVGSDQVWNITFPFISEVEFLNFVPPEKRISYAASFGISNIPDKYIETVRAGLSGMDEISVRELNGQKIVRNISGREATLVLDPTLLLTRKEWKAVEKKPYELIPEKYIFTYFLGENNVKGFIASQVQSRNCELISVDLYDKNISMLDIGPAEFVYLINHAELIITDSFHGSALSILFQRPFIVSNRKTDEQCMSSRIDTLLETFELENRKFENIQNNKQIFVCNYDKINSLLEQKKKESISFLKFALNVK